MKKLTDITGKIAFPFFFNTSNGTPVSLSSGDDFDGAGNFFNKYESRNPLIRILMKKFLDDIEKMILPYKGDITSALDVGCGEGYVTFFIHEMGIPIIGSDISSRIIHIAKKKYRNIDFIVTSIYDLSSMRTKYDLIIINEVLEHVSHPDEAMDEVIKISEKYIFVSVPNEPFFRLANILRLKYLPDFGNTPGHVNHWSRNQFRNFLISRGLQVKEIKSSSLWTIALCKVLPQ